MLSPAAATAQSPATIGTLDSLRIEIESATAEIDSPRLGAVVASINRSLRASPSDPWLLHYKGYALYRVGVIAAANKQKAEAKIAFTDAEQALESSATSLALAETFAIRSAIIGQRLALGGGPFTAIRLGPKADAALAEAKKLGADNPRVWLIDGMSSLFKPKAFGGGVDKATARLAQAIVYFERDHPLSPNPDWGHAEAYAWMGQALERAGKLTEARAAYERALELQPTNKLVRLQFLAELERRTSP